MKLLFTADIHIKLGQKNVPVEWAKNRFNLLTSRLRDLQDKVELNIIGGDIFDKLPNMEELESYFNMLSAFEKPTLIYSGNHEAIKKDTTFLSYLKTATNRINPQVTIIDDYWSGHGIDIIPYNRLKDFEKNGENTFSSLHKRILCTHVRGEIPPHVKPEVDLSIFDPWKLVLAGDLHSYENSQRNILYPGSPVTTSFHRNEVDTGVLIVDTETLTHQWVKMKLPQLLRKTVKVGDPMEPTEYHHTVYELEGDLSELSNVADNELLDKKVTKRSVDTTLILDPEATLEEEVVEYLRFILELNDDTIELVLKEFNNYSKDIYE